MSGALGVSVGFHYAVIKDNGAYTHSAHDILQEPVPTGDCRPFLFHDVLRNVLRITGRRHGQPKWRKRGGKRWPGAHTNNGDTCISQQAGTLTGEAPWRRVFPVLLSTGRPRPFGSQDYPIGLDICTLVICSSGMALYTNNLTDNKQLARDMAVDQANGDNQANILPLLGDHLARGTVCVLGDA